MNNANKGAEDTGPGSSGVLGDSGCGYSNPHRENRQMGMGSFITCGTMFGESSS